jgi:transcription elongation factor Elf1
MNERQQKVREIERLRSQVKSVGASGILHSLLGDSTTHRLEVEQMGSRISDLNSQIRSIDFEIDTLKRALPSASFKPMHYQIADSLSAHRFRCPNCGVERAVSDMTFEKMKKEQVGICKICGAPAKVTVDNATNRVSFEKVVAFQQKNENDDPLQILKVRLAKGEISKEEYEDLKKHIES